MKCVTVLLGLTCCFPARPATAQTFANLRPDALPTVFATDRAGVETTGRLVSLTDSAVVIRTTTATRTFAPSELALLERQGDSLRNGTLIGLAVGVVVSGTIGASCLRETHCSGTVIPFMLIGAGVYTAIGTAIDAAIPGRTRIWPDKARSGAPVVSILPHRAFFGWRTR